MSDDEKDPKDFDINKQIQDFLKSANIQFTPGMGMDQPEGGPAHPDDHLADEETEEILQRIRTFNLKPKEVRDYLDRFVIKQNEAKKVISVAICDHFNHVRQCIDDPALREKSYAKQNIILLGPTGVGKTYLMRCIAKLIGVPFVKADATKFSETGYVGHDVDDMIRDLVRIADGNTELAQYGIIYIDEIDKIAAQGSQGGKDVSGRGVQVNLLKLMEETEVTLQSQTDLMGQMQAMMEMQKGKSPQRTLNTRHILFIVSGAFDKLSELVEKRVDASSIGFARDGESKTLEEKTEYLQHATATDFIKYGFEPEFIGRLPIRVACSALNQDDLLEILTKSEESVLEQYRSDFNGYDIRFDITREALTEIAAQAEEEKTGARGLMTVLERSLRDFKFELPSTTIKSFEVQEETIKEPTPYLKKLLKDNSTAQRELLRREVDAFSHRFLQEHNLELTFNNEAVDALVEQSLDLDKTIRALCEEKFKDFHYGLKLINSKNNQKTFTLNRDAVEDPDRELSKWVVEHYPK